MYCIGKINQYNAGSSTSLLSDIPVHCDCKPNGKHHTQLYAQPHISFQATPILTQKAMITRLREELPMYSYLTHMGKKHCLPNKRMAIFFCSQPRNKLTRYGPDGLLHTPTLRLYSSTQFLPVSSLLVSPSLYLLLLGTYHRIFLQVQQNLVQH